MPVALETLTVNELGLGAIDGTFVGGAELTFDNTDLETDNGYPKPIGEAFLLLRVTIA